ncbi:MAG: hypothetical protein ABFD89_06825 [Bryobacteraceae bacterium]
MTFNLKDLVAKITGLEQRAEAAFKAELTELKNTVTTTLANVQTELATAQAAVKDLTAKLGTATTDLSAATGSLNTSKTELTAAATALRSHLASLPGHEDYKEGGAKAKATLTELITAEQNATNTALAATGVKADKLPAGGKAPEAESGKIVNLTEACLKANKKA